MEQRTKVMMTFAILMFLMFGLYFFTDWFSKVTGYVLGEDEKVKIAQCLSNKEAVLYTSPNCIPCREYMKEWEGESTQYLNVVQCLSVEDCPDVNGVPAWRINGKLYYQEISFNQLKQISGC